MQGSEGDFDTYLEKTKEGGEWRAIIDKQSTDVKLEIYGLGKQGKLGDNNESKPGMFAVKEKAKWEAWSKVKGMSQEEARQKFMALVDKVRAGK